MSDDFGKKVEPTTSFAARKADWRFGALVYQIFVDRFAPSEHLETKAGLYPPGMLRTWDQMPKATSYDEKLGNYPHVLEFWGGDLESIRSKLGYVKELGADVLYITPIFKSPSNHKYDTENYFEIDPQFGSTKDLTGLISDVHAGGMKLVLDGVFNHIGLSSPLFQDALHHPDSPHRDWFFIGPQYKLGYRPWANVVGMPGWRLESPGAREYLYAGKDSVVRHYLNLGADGWRLDVGYELGPHFLGELTASAHQAKPGSWVVGEVLGYPAGWSPALDGVFDFHMTGLAERMVRGEIDGGVVGQMFADVVADAGIENLLKGWILVDNHDTPRLASKVPDLDQRKILLALLMTLPGSPVLYYGTELGMEGVGDPSDRAPMRWDLVTPSNDSLSWVKKLVAARKAHASLRYGNFKTLASRKLLAFQRMTDKVLESAIVIINPTEEPVTEILPVRLGHLMSYGPLKDQISGETFRSYNGIFEAKLSPRQVMILTPESESREGYSPYNRIP